MLARFPQLDGFKNLWPINDLIKSRLKATSSLHRKKESLKEAGKEAGGKRTLAERTRSKVLSIHSETLFKLTSDRLECNTLPIETTFKNLADLAVADSRT
jgi:hypothetical protein